MLKTLITSALAIIAIGSLHAQEVKTAPRKPIDRTFRRLPPLPQWDSAQEPPKPKTIVRRRITSRDTLIRTLTNGSTNPDYYLIASHRAQINGGTEPENSMEAIRAVVNQDIADIVELDIKKSSDNVVYVMHDNYLQRTTDFLDKFRGVGTGHPNDPYGSYNTYSWAQVNSLTLKQPDFSYTHRGVPTFRNVLRYIRDHTSLLINLDIGDTAVLRATWNVVRDEDAFDVCIFKTAQFTVNKYKTEFYDPLPLAQKAKVIFFPMIIATPVEGGTPAGNYNLWENSGLARGYEIGYRSGGAGEADLLNVVGVIRAKNRVRVHVFNTLPDNYQGRYMGNTNINQCCNDAYDSRGNWEYLLDPLDTGTMDKGANGYIITDDPVTLATFLDILRKRQH